MALKFKSSRRFISPYWDKPPVGYENVSPKEYKAMQAAGKVPHTVVNPSSQHLQSSAISDAVAAAKAAAANINSILAAGGVGTGTGSSGGGVGGSIGGKSMAAPLLTRQARRLYVGNIPIGSTDEEVIELFRVNMKQPGNPVLACQINLDKNFAFLEFRSVEETSAAMALDGLMCKGQALKIRRPHDYQPVPGSEPAPTATSTGGGGPPVIADSPNKIYVGGLPTYLAEDQIKDLLQSFGQLRAFNLIKDPSTLSSKGYAFCEYMDPAITEHAIASLNGFDIGDKKLTVQRALVGSKSGSSSGNHMGGGGGANLGSHGASTLLQPVQLQIPGLPALTPNSTPRVLTEVLCLMNMVEPNDLKDDQEYREILEDIEDECMKYGKVKAIEIPRPSSKGDDDEPVPGLGKVFVEFDSATEAQRAQQNLAGRRFANRLVVVSYFDRDRFKNKEF